MTDEAGAVTGDLELETFPEEGRFHARIRYVGADEWYTVSGGPVDETDATHERVVEHLTMPGPIVGGNEEAVSLRSFTEA